MNTFSLFDLNEYIRRVLALNFQESIWVRAEIGQLKLNRGHFYLDLVEKSQETDEIVAQTPAILWKADRLKMVEEFSLDFEELLHEGAEVRLRVWLDFHERFGLKLLIKEIDPAFTIGKLELTRRQTVKELQRLNLLQKNGLLPLPKVLKRVAVISNEAAAGFQDFEEHLAQNSPGFRFELTLFSAAVQGKFVAIETVDSLEKINLHSENFDCAVLIRGGGARVELTVYDSLEICRAAADLKIPLLTGIGHETDETALDLVAHASLKTPTAVADFLINHNQYFESSIAETVRKIQWIANNRIQFEKQASEIRQKNLTWAAAETCRQATQKIDFQNDSLKEISFSRIKSQSDFLNQAAVIAEAFDPQKVLRRGYSMTFQNGKLVRSVPKMKTGDRLVTRFHDGEIESMAG